MCNKESCDFVGAYLGVNLSTTDGYKQFLFSSCSISVH